jgi:hypothetical protein
LSFRPPEPSLIRVSQQPACNPPTERRRTLIASFIHRWTRLEDALAFLGRLLAPHHFLVPLYRRLMAAHLDGTELRKFDEMIALLGELQDELKRAQHMKQEIEMGPKVTSSAEWFEATALVDLLLGKMAHDLLRVMLSSLLEEAGL